MLYMDVGGQEEDERYIPILLPDMVKEYFFRMGVNLETMSKMMKE